MALLLVAYTVPAIKIKKVNSNYGRGNNLDILLNNSNISLYWLGFILADGHIENNSRLKINLSDKDKEHLNKFALYTDCLVKDYKSFTKGTEHSYCSISVTNNKVISQLSLNFDISNSKTYNPPKISSYNLSLDQFICLILGFIDGDGHIQVDRTYPRIQISIHKSWLANLKFIEKQLYNKFPYFKKVGTLAKIREVKDCAFLQIGNTNMVKDLKQFAIDKQLPILQRKWDKVII